MEADNQYKIYLIQLMTNYKPHFYDFVLDLRSGFGSTPQANPSFLELGTLCNLSKDVGSHFSLDHKYLET